MKIPQTMKDVVVSLAPGTNAYKWTETGQLNAFRNYQENKIMQDMYGFTEDCYKPENIPRVVGAITGFAVEATSFLVGLTYFNNNTDFLAVGAMALARIVSYKAAKVIGDSEKQEQKEGIDVSQLRLHIAKYT